MPNTKSTDLPLSIFDIFQIGVGPSSSHTVGPMNAGYHFAQLLAQAQKVAQAQRNGQVLARVQVELQGSLAATGKGHATDRAVLAGLEGHQPVSVGGQVMANIMEIITENGQLQVAGTIPVPFQPAEDLVFNPQERPEFHVNSLVLRAWDEAGKPLAAKRYYSTGGGFVTLDSALTGPPGQLCVLGQTDGASGAEQIPHPYSNLSEMLDLAHRQGKSLSELVAENEKARRSEAEIHARLDHLAAAMIASIERGMATEGTLPGGLRVLRRAPSLAAKLSDRLARGEIPTGEDNNAVGTVSDPLRAMDWVNLWALAVNEENAAGGQIVRAPTNGAAGVVPAVLRYLLQFSPEAAGENAPDCTRRFLLVAGAVGAIIKKNASIAGAEVGCQGEVGSACTMAAAGLAEAWNATPAQVENAAEIAMEHCLGLTCDPIGGLVQIPCIERNAIAAIHAINAARLALWGDGTHRVTFDEVVETMRQTGMDMNSKYKETAAGGLAVNVVEC